MQLRNLIIPCLVFAVVGSFSLAFGQANISGIINNYTEVTGFPAACQNQVTVSSVAGFSVGDTVLIIQMSGATINTTNTASYGDILSYNEAGNYETAEIIGISGVTISLRNDLQRAYNEAFRVQMITVPQYTDVNINGTLTAQAWNGTTGGVLIFQASGTVTFGADIDVSHLGYRLGARSVNGCGTCTMVQDFSYPSPTDVAGDKGEGISTNGNGAGMGKRANGGGGGNCHNAGGGGGGNAGAGGRGGDRSSTCGWGATNGPGVGGAALTYSNAANKVFMGGGGGGGHQNNNLGGSPPGSSGGTSGGSGGGIVIIIAGTMDGNDQSIISRGEGILFPANEDAGGAGGAGGSVLLDVPVYTSPINIDVSGGRGDSTTFQGANNRGLGPGGGGGGGIVWVSTVALDANISTTLNGGVNGVSRQGNSAMNAAPGDPGMELGSLVIPTGNALPGGGCVLPVDLLSFTAIELDETVKITWETATEHNNSFFILEKSDDLQHFAQVETVPGSENSLSLQKYTVIDHRPYGGNAYYRLTEFDLDGSQKVLGVIKVKVKLDGEGAQKIFPNPVGSGMPMSTEFYINSDQMMHVILMDRIGKDVYHEEYTYFEAGNHRVEIPTDGLPEGMYYVLLKSKAFISHGRVSVFK